MYKRKSNLIHLFLCEKFAKKGAFIMNKKLVAFFSASGTTKKVAEMIAEEAKADKINGMILVNEKSGKNMMGNLVRYIMEKMIIENSFSRME